ncbi:MAG: family 10 glycosylhydrolase [Candidatus Omnitrophica bacterium]|nr:family 10 glycosylhydrolase [Candidatus Omnitrophota bacterium]
MKNKIILLVLFSLIIFFAKNAIAENPAIKKGVWVTVFSEKKVLYSKEAATNLIELCKKAKINEIYLQVYQSGNAYYDSEITDRFKYEDMVKSAGVDPVEFLLNAAHKNNIKVFAWVNLLSLGQNDKAGIINKFGRDVLTRDQYLRTSGTEGNNESDKYYHREGLLFLEPGDQRVVKYLITIVEEIIDRYPLFDGVHLDYARYPMTVPFIPGSRFTKYGLSYGYGPKNVERFKEWTTLDPLTGLKKNKDYAKWDDWRRQQVTSLVNRIAKSVKKKSPALLVSSAVIYAPERAYLSLFQDWSYWLEEGVLDYVVLMNYMLDNQLTKEMVRSSFCNRQQGKVFIGIGLYLMKDEPQVFFEQYRVIKGLFPDGIVFFSYDDITEEIADYLGKS